jgi:hypothetical protein
MTTTFNVGDIVHVFETKGCRDLKSGVCSSERIDGEYPNIEPTEDLKVIKKLGSTRALCERGLDGATISVHINHITAASAYYAARGQPKAPKAPRAPKGSKKTELAAAQAEVQKLEADLESKLESELEAEDARDEAAALFAEEAVA